MSFFHVFHNKQTAYINFVQLQADIFCQMLSLPRASEFHLSIWYITLCLYLFFIFLSTAACSRKDSCQRNLIAWGVGRRERIFCDWCYATKHSTTCLCAWTSACTSGWLMWKAETACLKCLCKTDISAEQSTHEHSSKSFSMASFPMQSSPYRG